MLKAAIAGVAAAAGLGLAAQPAMAQADACRGTALKTGNLVILQQGLTLASANNKETGCATDYQKAVGLGVPLTGALKPLGTLLGVTTGTILQVGVVDGLTGTDPALGNGASARVAYVKLNVLGFTLEIGGVESMARARLIGCSPFQQGYSDVASLKINGKAQLVGNGPARIPLLGLGNIYLNQTIDEEYSLTQRAVFVDLPGDSLDITLGESKAGTTACAP